MRRCTVSSQTHTGLGLSFLACSQSSRVQWSTSRNLAYPSCWSHGIKERKACAMVSPASSATTRTPMMKHRQNPRTTETEPLPPPFRGKPRRPCATFMAPSTVTTWNSSCRKSRLQRGLLPIDDWCRVQNGLQDLQQRLPWASAPECLVAVSE